IEEGERIGLVGANGSGKSTLGRILAGVEEADRGGVVTRRGMRVAYLPQEPRFEGDPSVREAALSGLGAWREAMARYEEASAALARGELERLEEQAEAAAEVERLGGYDRAHQAEAVLDRLGIADRDRRVSTLSGGERRRVDLARLLVAKPELAILDEPTNHLDVDTIEWLEAHLRDEQPGAILLITHDRFFLDRLVTRTAELDRGVLRVYQGGYEAYLEAKAEREAHEARAERNRQNLLRRELDWLRRSAPARTTKQKARIDRARAALAQRAPRAPRTAVLEVDTVRSGKTVLELENVRLEVGDRVLVDGLTLSLTPGERLGIVGPNGAGKTTLLRAILGEIEPSGGRIVLGQNARITYLGQKREGLDESATVLENVAGGRSKVTLGERTMDARAYLDRFLFDAEQQRQPVATLSGGEKARVLLAKLLLTPANLFVLDEPTNDLDVATLAALEELLLEVNGTALVVTHDRWFLDRVATGVLAFEGGGRVVRYPGGYTMYRALRPSAEPASAPAPARPRAKPAAPKRRGLTYGEQLELEGIIDRIAAAEEKVAALEAQLADPEVYADGGGAAAQLVASLERARDELAELMARWEELESKKAES
ncbi:MAG TPA: ABC-F family ATP-binding cassette domain-containing protein, partial [Sandaracinaceae bacterium]